MGKEYEMSVDQQSERRKNESYFKAFEIPQELKRKRNDKKITVVLGKQDKIVPYKQASRFWKGYNTKAYNVGHISMVSKAGDIKRLANKFFD